MLLFPYGLAGFVVFLSLRGSVLFPDLGNFVVVLSSCFIRKNLKLGGYGGEMICKDYGKGKKMV